MKIAGRQPTWKAPGLGWERKNSNELTSIRLHSHADPLAHTNVDGGQHLDFIPWHIIPLLSWNRGTTQGDQLIEMTLNRLERILCFLEEWALERTMKLRCTKIRKAVFPHTVTHTCTYSWFPHHLSGWCVRRELDTTSISSWGDLGKSRYLSEFQYPHLLSRTGLKTKMFCRNTSSAAQKSKGGHFMRPGSRFPCTSSQLGQRDSSLIFFLMYWNQSTESRVYDAPSSMVYFHRGIVPDLFLFHFFSFSPVSIPVFDSNSGNLTYFPKLPSYFVYI